MGGKETKDSKVVALYLTEKYHILFPALTVVCTARELSLSTFKSKHVLPAIKVDNVLFLCKASNGYISSLISLKTREPKFHIQEEILHQGRNQKNSNSFMDQIF